MNPFQSNIRKLYIFNFLEGLYFVAGVMIPFFLDWGKISFTQIMILQSLFVFFAFALEVPTGAIADYFGRKTSLILADLAAILAAGVYSSYPNFYIFIAGEFLFALAFSLTSGAAEALVYDSLKELGQEKQSKKIFARVRSCQLAAIMIGAPLGSIIGAYIGLQYAMMLMAVPFSLAFLLAFTLKEPKPEKITRTSYLQTIRSGVSYFRGHRALKALAFDRISIAVLVFMLIWTYQPKLMQLSVPILYFGFIHTAFTGNEILFTNKFELLERLFGGKKGYLFSSAVISGAAFILLGLTSHVAIAISLFVLIAGFGLSREVLFISYMNKHIESKNRATVLSTVSMIERLSMGLLYLAVGPLVRWSLTYALIAIGSLIIIFAIISRVEEAHLID